MTFFSSAKWEFVQSIHDTPASSFCLPKILLPEPSIHGHQGNWWFFSYIVLKLFLHWILSTSIKNDVTGPSKAPSHHTCIKCPDKLGNNLASLQKHIFVQLKYFTTTTALLPANRQYYFPTPQNFNFNIPFCHVSCTNQIWNSISKAGCW